MWPTAANPARSDAINASSRVPYSTKLARRASSCAEAPASWNTATMCGSMLTPPA
jgi:hypothetical protein